MVKATFSKTYAAKKSRIQRLPKVGPEVIQTSAKRDAIALIEIFHDGIKNRRFGLVALMPATISRKEAHGMTQPETPLYGTGDEDQEKTTYANMMRITKDDGKRKFFVRPADEDHYQTEDERAAGQKPIKLKDLFAVHEYGRTIENGFGMGILIRIPPRPAFHTAFNELMRGKKRKERTKLVREAIVRYVRAGDAQAIEEMAKQEGDHGEAWEKWDAK